MLTGSSDPSRTDSRFYCPFSRSPFQSTPLLRDTARSSRRSLFADPHNRYRRKWFSLLSRSTYFNLLLILLLLLLLLLLSLLQPFRTRSERFRLDSDTQGESILREGDTKGNVKRELRREDEEKTDGTFRLLRDPAREWPNMYIGEAFCYNASYRSYRPLKRQFISIRRFVQTFYIATYAKSSLRVII